MRPLSSDFGSASVPTTWKIVSTSSIRFPTLQHKFVRFDVWALRLGPSSEYEQNFETAIQLSQETVTEKRWCEKKTERKFEKKEQSKLFTNQCFNGSMFLIRQQRHLTYSCMNPIPLWPLNHFRHEKPMHAHARCYVQRKEESKHAEWENTSKKTANDFKLLSPGRGDWAASGRCRCSLCLFDRRSTRWVVLFVLSSDKAQPVVFIITIYSCYLHCMHSLFFEFHVLNCDLNCYIVVRHGLLDEQNLSRISFHEQNLSRICQIFEQSSWLEAENAKKKTGRIGQIKPSGRAFHHELWPQLIPVCVLQSAPEDVLRRKDSRKDTDQKVKR